MSCYFHSLKDILAEAGIEVTAKNRKQIDEAFHQIVGMGHTEGCQCPATWKKLKEEWLTDDKKKKELAQKLKKAMQGL